MKIKKQRRRRLLGSAALPPVCAGFLVGAFVGLLAVALALSLSERAEAVHRGLSVGVAFFAGALGVLAYLRTRRHGEIEAELQESRKRLEDILEHSTNLFYSHTPDHRLTYVSPQTRSFFGCEPEEALRRWTEFMTDHPVNLAGLELTERAIASGERQPVYELEVQGLDGRLRWVEVNEAPVVRHGETVAIVGALTDVTERRRVEEDRRRLEERLRLGQRLEAVGRLAGGVAHDFNNLLTAILGYCELLSTRLGTDHPLHREVEEIRRSGRRAASLIDQLLAFSRRQVIAPRVLDLNATLEEATRLVRRLIGEDVELECRLASEPLLVEADPNQLEQVLVNLAANARDAMPTGGRLVVETERRRLETSRPGDLFDVVPGEYCHLTVTDTGDGMDSRTLDHLFEPFFTTKEVGRGTGLGLATVYGIVKQNAGYIWVDSEPGSGTRFEIYLPVSEQARVSEGDGALHRTGRARRPATVLLVEDEEAVRRLVREVLAEHGYDVLEAADSAEALALVEDGRTLPDLVVTDLVMPGLQGDSLVRCLAAERPGLAVLFISGYPESVLTRRGVLHGGHRLLQKPFMPEDLVAAVEDALAEEAPGGGELVETRADS